MVIHGVLKQGNHDKISWRFETDKPWYTIHLPNIIYEKAWSTTVYHVMSWYTMVYHIIPCDIAKYHGMPCNSMGYHGIPWYIFIRANTAITCPA